MVKNFNWKDLLLKHSLFLGLNLKEVERIIEQLLDDRVSEEMEYFEGKVIVREGEPGDSVFLVGSGSVQVLLEGKDGYEIPIATLQQGEFFGEMALLEKRPRAATVRARQGCTLLEIKGQEFLKLLDEHRDVESKMLLKLSERLRQANEQVLAVKVTGVDDKLERFNEGFDAKLKLIDASVAEARAMTKHTSARAEDIITSFERTRTWLTWILSFVTGIITLGGLVSGGIGYWYVKEIDRLFDKAKQSVTQIEEFDGQIKTIRNNLAANLVIPLFRDALKKKDMTDAFAAYDLFLNIQPQPKLAEFSIPLYEIQQSIVNDKQPKNYTELLTKILADAKTADKADDVTHAYYLLLTNDILIKNEPYLKGETFRSTFTALDKYIKANKDRIKIKNIPTIATQSFSSLSDARQEKLRELSKLFPKN